ncbi:MAG: hypothetical protein J5953_03360 [Prevotella sp.]|jgi:hypothetical protein|nr:hypothetical protein [Prevotella sp.]
MIQNQKLSPHFELREFIASLTAKEHGIDNTPPEEAVENLRALCQHTLEPLRNALGLPIIITSGYRCKALNHLLVNHSVKSQHMEGEAADFYVGWNGSDEEKPSRRELLIKAFRQIITDDAIAFDQLIIYPSFIHVSYVRNGRKNRNKLTKAFANGSYAALTRAQALSLE